MFKTEPRSRSLRSSLLEAVKAWTVAQGQVRVAAGEYQLLNLREELDFPNTAATELDVMPEKADLMAAALRVYLALDVLYFTLCPKIQMFAPNEGRQLA